MTARLCLLVLACLLAFDGQRIRLRFVPDPNQGSASSPIAANRVSPYWSSAGATIVDRSTECVTSQCNTAAAAGTSATTAELNAAIASAPNNTVITLAAGTYTMNDGIEIQRSSVTLRGVPGSTKIVLASGCSNGGMCIQDTVIYDWGSAITSSNWTAGYSRGTTTITLASVTGLSVGSLIILDQLNDSIDDLNNDVCLLCQCGAGQASSGGVCCINGSCNQNIARSGRGQEFFTTVTAINGNDVTIADPIIPMNFRSGQDPEAWWHGSAGANVSSIGVEGITFDVSGLSALVGGIVVWGARDVWFKDVAIVAADNMSGLRAMIRFVMTPRFTFRDSYIRGDSGTYGIELFGTSNSLIENNILTSTGAPVADNSMGNVIAYNYIKVVGYPSNGGWMMPSVNHHSAGNMYNLSEGNYGGIYQSETTHGTAHINTAFRNRFTGWEPGKLNHTPTVPIQTLAFQRLHNFVGNVLGTHGYHTVYERYTGGPDTGSCVNIYTLGLSGTCSTDDDPPDDDMVRPSVLRWVNWDVVTSTDESNSNDTTGIKADSGEVPSALSGDSGIYANSVPSSQAIPVSLYLSAKPSWWPVGKAWPPIGPDVTSGNEANTGGHAYTLPAQDCFDGLSIDTNFSTANPITGVTYSSGTVTYTLTNNHGYGNGQLGALFTVSGVTPSGYNGTFGIASVPGVKTITVTMLSDPGSYSSGGNFYYPAIRVYPGCN